MFNIIKNFIVENYLDDLKKEINLRKDIVNINDISFSEERQTCWMSNKDYTYMYVLEFSFFFFEVFFRVFLL